MKTKTTDNRKTGQVGIRWLVLSSLILLSHSLCWAQSSKDATADAGNSSSGRKHIVGFSVGHTVLFGEWGSLYDDSITYNLFYSYEASPVFGLLFNAGLGNHTGVGDNSLTIRSLEPDLKVNFMYFDMLVLYGFGGFGVYPVSQQVGTASGSTLNFGMNLGLGLDLRIDEHLTFGPGLQLKSIFSKTDKDAKSGDYPSGLNIGGETMRLFVQIGYIF